MVRYVQKFLGVSVEEANRLRADYWHSHGTTLAGMMDNHAMPPEDFLRDVHDIDFSILPPDPELADLIAGLPGRKLIYTNGTAAYARKVLKARGLSDGWDGIYGVEHAGFRPKPERAAFEKVFAFANVPCATALMFEDEARNLEVPKAMGLQTVHVAPARAGAYYIDHHTACLTDFLSQVLADGSAAPK